MREPRQYQLVVLGQPRERVVRCPYGNVVQLCQSQEVQVKGRQLVVPDIQVLQHCQPRKARGEGFQLIVLQVQVAQAREIAK